MSRYIGSLELGHHVLYIMCEIAPEFIRFAVVALYQALLIVAQGPHEQLVNLSTSDFLSYANASSPGLKLKRNRRLKVTESKSFFIIIFSC